MGMSILWLKHMNMKQFEQWTSRDLTVPLHESQHQASCGIKCQLGIETGWMALGLGWRIERGTIETYLYSSLACFQGHLGAQSSLCSSSTAYSCHNSWGIIAAVMCLMCSSLCDPIITVTKAFSF